MNQDTDKTDHKALLQAEFDRLEQDRIQKERDEKVQGRGAGRYKPAILLFMLLAIAYAGWAGVKSTDSYEKVPAGVELTELAEVEDGGTSSAVHLTGLATNKTSRGVGKAVYKIQYAGGDPPIAAYVVLTDLHPGAKQRFSVLIPQAQHVPSGRTVVPDVIKWL